MFYVLQNESTAARRRVPILLTDAATGTTAQTGVATTNIYAYVNINGGAFIGGTGNVAAAGFGQYYYEFESNEVATLGLAGIHVTALGCRDYDAISQIAAFDLYSASAGGGISAYDIWQYPIPLSGQSAEDTLGNAANFASSADSNAITAASNTTNIALQVWGDDLAAGANSPYAAGTAGTILYTLGQGGTALTAGDVWDYASRTITGGIADTVTLVTSPVDITTSSMSGIANTVWSTDISGYTSPSAGFDLTQAASGAGLTAGDVWDFTVTGFGGTGSAAVALSGAYSESANTYNQLVNFTPSDIWSYAGIEGRTITGGIADTVTTLTDRSGFAITGGTVDTVTNAVDVSTSSMSGIANTVWSTLTAPYTTHATFGHQILRSDNAATIGEVTLHQSGGSKRVDADVHAFVNNTASATAMLNILTGIGASMTTNITGNLSGSVGSVTNPVDVSTSSMSGIANTVWATDVSGYTSPSAGFDLSNASSGAGLTAGDVWSYATREITGGIADTVTTVSGNVLGSVNSVVSDVTISTGTQASIANSVWSFDISTGPASPSASYYINNINTEAQSAATDASTAASNTNDIGGTVWASDVTGYVTPGEAGFELTQAAAGAGLTSGDVSVAVWDADPVNYSNNSTFGKGILRSDNAGVAGTVTLWTGASYNGVYADTYRIDGDYGAATALRDVLTGIGSSITANITGDLSGSVGSVTADVNVSTTSMTGIAGTVWSTDISGYSSPSAGYSLYNASAGAAISAYDVWNFDPTAMTSPQAGAILTDIQTDTNTIITDIGNIPNNVWASDVSGYSTPGEAGFELSQAAAGAGLTSGDVWSYATRTITGGIADTVTTITDRSGFAITGGTVDTVTNPVTFDSVQYAGIASSVWNAATRTLTSSGSGISAFDVWNFVLSDSNTAEVDLVQAAAGSGLTAGDVWSAPSRTITGGIADTVTTLTNRSGFAITGGTVDTVTNGVTVSTNNDKTGYALSSTQTFNMTGNITGNVSGSVGSVSGAVGSVAGNVGGNVVGSVASVTNPVSIATSSMTGIAGTVWTYGTRTLTSGGGITAGDVWTYNISAITNSGTAGKQLNDAAVSGSVVQIINGPYRLTSTAEGSDGRLDILQDSVQTIELGLIDVFGSPINISGNYTLSVDVYDESGALTVSYVPTIAYAGGGLINFDLDTDVTGVLGRYTIVVSLTDGDVIQVGPLQVLVRPL